MSLHDDFIKKAYKEIDKLTADIEKKKSRIVELRASIKKHETDRTRDSEFSDTILRLLSDNGIDTELSTVCDVIAQNAVSAVGKHFFIADKHALEFFGRVSLALGKEQDWK